MGSPTYNKEHTKTVLLCFNLKTDKDILHKLETCGNKQGYIKRLIRADLKRTCPDIDEMIESSAKQEGE